jgi:iron complex outermembrane recepter protein
MPAKSFHKASAAALAALLASLAPSTQAQQTSSVEDGDVETILVTERMLRGELELTPGGMTLIDGDSLRERNVSSLADLLRYVPGVWSASAAGTDTMFFSSRGSNLDATDYDMNGIELLQDGLPVTTADGNNHNRVLDPLSAEFATIARGANALKYGASTLGGAIDFTSPTARNSMPFEVFTNVGSHGQLLARGTAGNVFSDELDALFTVEGKRWEGYREHNEQRRVGLYANAGWRPSERVESRFFLTYLDNDQKLPGSLSRAQLAADPDQANPAALTGNFQIDVETVRLANKTTVQLGANRRLDLGFSIEEQSLFHPIVDVRIDFDGPGPGLPVQVFSLLVDTDHRELGGLVRYSQQVGEHDILLGLNYGSGHVAGGDYTNQNGAPGTLTTIVDNDATGLELYALDRWQLGERVLLEYGAQGVLADRDVTNIDAATGSVRAPSGDFSRVNPRLGVIYDLADGVDLFANLSGLFEPPTNFELEDDVRGGESTLRAMQGTVLEVGARGRRELTSGKRLAWELALYHGAIEDEILSIDDPAAPGTSLSANIDDTTHAGIEATFSADLPIGGGGVLAPQLSLTINDFSFAGDAVYGDNELPAAPGYLLRGELIYRHPSGFYVGPTIDVVDDRFADFSNTYRVASYSLVGLRAGWARDRWQAFVELVNAADKDYVSTVGVRDLAAPGAEILNPGEPRSAYLGARGRF